MDLPYLFLNEIKIDCRKACGVVTDMGIRLNRQASWRSSNIWWSANELICRKQILPVNKALMRKMTSTSPTCADQKKIIIGPVDPARIGPFQTDHVRSSSKFRNLKTRLGPPCFIFNWFQSCSFKFRPDPASA